MRLVLGSEGQIGNFLCSQIGLTYSDRVDKEEHGQAVWGYDIEYGPEQDLRNWANMRELKQFIKDQQIEFVYFLAFDVGGSQYLKKHEKTYEFLDNNMKLMQNTFDVLKDTEVPFLFASSQMSSMNHSPYGVLKRLGEFYTKTLGGINVRFWNVYGYEQDEKKFHVISDFVRMAEETGHIHIKTTGLEERQFLWVGDCVKALRTLEEQRFSINKTVDYDITSGQWINIQQVAATVADVVGEVRPVQVTVSKQRDQVQDGVKNEPNDNMFKLWKPTTTLREGITEIYREMYPTTERAGGAASA